MRRRVSFLAIILPVFVLIACGPGGAWARTVGGAHKFLDIRQVTSDGGITAWLVEDHSLPIVALQFQFRDSGAAYDPEGKEGLAQLASNTMDEGAGPYDSQAFQKRLEDNSIDLRFSSSRDVFGGRVETLSRHRDEAFELLRLALTAPRFDREPLDRMKAANIARIRSSLSDPDWIAARILNDVAFQGHPYARNAGGTISGLSGIVARDLQTFVRQSFGRDKLIVAAAGDITPDELKKRLDAVFGELPAQAAARTLPDGEVRNGGSTTLFTRDMPQTVLAAMQPGIDQNDPDYYAAQIMNFILGGSGFGSRLMDEIREKRGLTYGIYTGLYDLDHLDSISVSASFQNENAAQVLDLVRQEWARMKDRPVDAREIKAAKSYLIGSMPLTLTSTDSIANLLVNLQYDRRPIDYLDKRAAYIDAVTVDDVRRVSARLLQPGNLTTVLVGKPQNVKPTRTIDAIPDVE